MDISRIDVVFDCQCFEEDAHSNTVEMMYDLSGYRAVDFATLLYRFVAYRFPLLAYSSTYGKQK